MRRSAVASSLLGLSVGLLAGCPDRSISEVNPIQGRVEAKDIPVSVNRDLDLLFVIDDSPSMNDKQINLAKNFPRFIDVLSSIPGGLPNVHIGVVTSDMGTQGAGDSSPSYGPTIGQINQGGCGGIGKDGNLQVFSAAGMLGAAGTDLYISDIVTDPVAGTRTRNYTVPPGQDPKVVLEGLFAKMAKAGAGGCGFEQHLEAIHHALQKDNPVNHGFLRDSAYLGIIVIADEDDCSLQHYSMLGGENTTLGPQQSFRCTRFGVTCDQNGQSSNAMNQIGPKGQCHPNDSSDYLTKVSNYVSFLKGLKNNPRQVIVAGILGATEPFATELRPPSKNATPIPALAHSCTYIGGDNNGDGTPDPEVADPPTRLKFFLDQFPNRSTFVSICQQDLSGGLQQIGDLLKTVIGDPCIEGTLKNFATATDPGPVYDCSVSYATNPGETSSVETLIPRCNTGNSNQPCWHIITDATNCRENPGNLALKIEGEDALRTMNKDIHILANCVTEVN